jgi:hypothetical protein
MGRFKVEIVENVRSKLRRVHLLVSQDGEQLFNHLVGHSLPAVDYGVEIENGLSHAIFVAKCDVLAQPGYL